MSNSLAGLAALVSSEHLDVVFLQEVRMSNSQIEALLPGFKAAVNVDHENPSTPGTAIIWRSSLPVDGVSSLVLCRLQIATLGPYRLANIYAPSGSGRKAERADFYGQDVFGALQLNADKPLLMGRDFNALLSPLDVKNGLGFQQKKCAALGNLVNIW